MITLYSGTPGSGKSLHAAGRIYNILRFRKDVLVISNVRFNLSDKRLRYKDHYIYYDNSDIKPDRILNDCILWNKKYEEKKEGRILIYLDEAQLLFNARTWQVNQNKGWLSFFTQHRKYGADVLFVAQSDRMIDRQIRSLIEYEYKHRKVSRFGLKGRILSLIFGGFVSVGVWYGIGEVVEREFFRYSKRISNLYDTFQLW